MENRPSAIPRAPEKPVPVRIPSLDGLLAISISMVLASHQGIVTSMPISPRLRGQIGRLGPSGVRVFFVLSGFLITSILLAELRKTNAISLRRFYLRRALRIAPAYLAFLICLAVLCAHDYLVIEKPSPRDFVRCLFYVSNYLPVVWPLSHTWSLSVEEQFYILWPAALAFLKPRKLILVSVICISPLFRYAALFGATIFSDVQFESVADALAVGCLFAVYREPITCSLLRWIPAACHRWVLPTAGLIIVLIDATANHPRILAPLGLSLMNLVIGCAILFAIECPPGWLNIPVLAGLGRISYSLYLWQQPLYEDVRLRYSWLIIALVCAFLSYKLIEQPILSWRDRKRWQ